MEVVIATAISMVVFGQLAITLVSSQRLLQETMGDMELSIAGRMLREKLLFKINENGGLLSGQKAKIAKVQKTPVNVVSYTPYNKSANKVKCLAGSPLFRATEELVDNWLAEGMTRLASDEVFTYSNNTIFASLDLKMEVGNHVYRQEQNFEAPSLCMLPAN